MKTKTIKIKDKEECHRIFCNWEDGTCQLLSEKKFSSKQHACYEMIFKKHVGKLPVFSYLYNKDCPFNKLDQIIFEVEK